MIDYTCVKRSCMTLRIKDSSLERGPRAYRAPLPRADRLQGSHAVEIHRASALTREWALLVTAQEGAPLAVDQGAIRRRRRPPRLIPEVYPARESTAAIAPPAVRNSRVAPWIEYVAAVANASKWALSCSITPAGARRTSSCWPVGRSRPSELSPSLVRCSCCILRSRSHVRQCRRSRS